MCLTVYFHMTGDITQLNVFHIYTAVKSLFLKSGFFWLKQSKALCMPERFALPRFHPLWCQQKSNTWHHIGTIWWQPSPWLNVFWSKRLALKVTTVILVCATDLSLQCCKFFIQIYQQIELCTKLAIWTMFYIFFLDSKSEKSWNTAS